MSAVAEFRALLASPIETVDHFVDLVESLPVVSKGHAEKTITPSQSSRRRG